MSVKVVAPTAELVEANRVVDGIIVLPEGITPQDDLSEVTGRIMFEEVSYALGGGGYNNGASRKVCFESGKVADLQGTIGAFGLKIGKTLPQFKLIVQESHAPYFAGQSPKVYPESSDYAGQEITSEGAPVYRQTIMIGTSDPRQDSKLPTDHRTAEAPNTGMESGEEAFTREEATA